MTSFLRSLSINQQISLLFVLLFGLLALASVVGLLLSLRERRQTDAGHDARLRDMRDNRQLLNVSWIMATVFWLGWAAGDGVATVLFGLLSFFALRE
ncbi:MAG TPA: phosphatidate cytidylyltransferase, partial [Burkholderiaceae bacterium]|nr:phosphatidate cytidylyltransferase [Burkholderiaceae bacterium]